MQKRTQASKLCPFLYILGQYIFDASQSLVYLLKANFAWTDVQERRQI